MLDRGIYQERIILTREGDVVSKVRLEQCLRSIRLQLQKIVLTLPHERDVLELLQVVGLLAHLGRVLAECAATISLLGNQEVVDELFPPFDDALDDVEGEHTKGVHYV